MKVTLFSQSVGFEIRGNVIGSDTGTIYVTGDNNGKMIAAGSVNSGKFNITGKITEPVKCTITTNFNDEPIPIFLENTPYNLIICNNPFSYTLTGGVLQQKFMEYGNSVIGYYEGWEQIKRIINRNVLSGLNTDGEYHKIMDELDSSAIYLEKRIIEKSESFIKEGEDSYITPRIISNFLLLNKNYVELADSSYEMLTDKIKKSSEGRYLINQINNIKNAPYPGEKITPFTLRNEKNIETTFDGPGTGKYVLINFWASWCLPCIREFPSLMQIYNEFKDKGFELINISIDTDKQRWLSYLSENKYPWPQLIDNSRADSSLKKRYRIQAIPSGFLIDGNMKIISINLTADQLRLKLKSLFKY